MVHAFNPEAAHLALNDPAGLARFENIIQKIGGIRLVVIDPIIDFSGDINPNAGEEVRALLTPLISIATRLDFALILVGHLNKSQAMSAVYRAGGSTSGWLGKCRAAFMVFRDADDKQLRRVAPLKANLAVQDPSQLEFRLHDGRIDIAVTTDEVDLDDQLNPLRKRGPEATARDTATKWLINFLHGRENVSSVEVEETAIENGITAATLRRAKQDSGFSSVKITDGDGKTRWVYARGSSGS